MIIDSPIISGSYAASGSLNQFGNVTITGSLTVTGPIIGALTGSVDSASFATTASYVSPNTQINTASFAVTSSYASTVDYNNTVITSSFAITASYVSPATQINTASFAITASYVSPATQINTSSFAITSSYAANAELLDGLDSSAFTPINSFNSYTSSNNATVTSVAASTALALASIATLTSKTGSYTLTSSFNSYTSSNDATVNCVSLTATAALVGVAALSSKTGSYATTGSNTFDGGQYFSSLFNPTGFTTTASLYTDGGLRVTKDAYISGTLYLNNVTVFGTQSVAYITSSQLNIGTNLITVNTDTPSVRFGGLAVYDSGSSGLTGSMLWDSQNNHWVYSNPSGSTYSGGMFISGPRSAALGSEQGTTSCMLLAGQGGDHLTSSMIYHSSTVTCIPNTLIGSTINSTMTNASCIGIGTSTPADQLSIFNSTSNTPATLRLAGSNRGGQINFYNQSCPTAQINVDQSGNVDILTGIFNGSSISSKFAISNTGQACFACTVCAPTAIFSGCVGIGTTSPSEKLHTIGNIKIEQTSNANAVLTLNPNSGTLGTGYQWNLVGTNSGGNYSFQIREASSAYLTITNSAGGTGGNVGIGITSPQSILHAQSGANVWSFNGGCACTAYNNNSNGFYTNAGNISITSQYGTVNWPEDYTTPSTTKPWWMLGNRSGTAGQWQLTLRTGYSGGSGGLDREVISVYSTGNDTGRTIDCIKFSTGAGSSAMVINSAGLTCFASTICAPVSVITGASIVSGCLGVGTGTPRTKAEFSSGLPTSIPTRTNTTSGIAVTDGGAIYGRVGVADLSAGGAGYPTYIQAGDWDGASYYNILLNSLGGNVGIGTTSPIRKLDIVTTGEQLRLAYDTSGTVYTDFRNDSAGGLLINTSGGYIVNYIGGSAKMRINPDSICFACQVCTPQICSTYVGASCYLEGVLKAGVRGCFVTCVAAIPHIYYGERFPNDASGAFPFNQYGELIFQGGTRAGYNSGFSFATGTADTGGTASVSVKARIFESGVACFACQVCTPRLHINTPDGCGLTLQYGANSGYAGISTDAANNLIFKAYIGNEYMRIACGGCIGIIQTSPETSLDIGNLANQAAWSSCTSCDANLGENFENNIIIQAQHAPGANAAYGYPTSNLVFRTSNASNAIWNVGAIQGVVDPFGGSYYQGGLVFLTRPASNDCNPTGRKTQGGPLVPILALGQNASNSRIAFFNSSVGIGTASPSTRLNVAGGDFRLNGVCSNSRFIVYQDYSNSAVGASLFNNSGTEVISLNGNAGNIGITGTMILNSRTVYATAAIYDNASAGNNVGIGFGPNSILPITGDGTASSGTKDLGSSSVRWRTVFTSDLDMSNGIGDYTIVEGEEDLFLYNNKTNKVFKFLIQEVNPSEATPKMKK